MKDDEILKLARERYAAEKERNADLRERQIDDIRFKAGKQWPEAIKRARESDPYGARPCLTINHARTHANAVINDIRQNRPQIKVLPVDSGADVETAEMMNGLLRHIQVAGDADLAYDTAMTFMVDMGEGYFEVVTKEIDAEGNQEADVEPIINPHSVHMDPSHENPTGADANWVFVDDPQLRTELEEQYPDITLSDWTDVQQGGLSDWYLDEDRVNAARYFYKETVDGETVWHVLKLVGDTILERSIFPGKHHPIIRVAGEESTVDGSRDVKGLIRDIKDPCRMYNYWASVNTERIALAPKAPYIGPAGAFEGHERAWQAANTANIPYLEYNAKDDEGNPLPAPQRAQPVQQDTAIIQAMLQAHDDIKAISGKFDASLGNRSNETSGVAIRNRDRQGDTLTFHYPDNLSRSIRQCGRVLVGLIPLLYTSERVVRILGEDDAPDFAQVAPTGQAYQEVQDGAGKIDRLFDLSVGTYDVTVKAGPSYATRRQEAVEEMAAILSAQPQAFQLIGHKLIRHMDWPGADEAADILEAVLPPEVKAITDAKKEGGDQVRAQVEMAQKAIMDQVEPAMQQLQQQAGEAAQAAKKMMEENAMLKLDSRGKEIEIREMQAALRDKAEELQIEMLKIQADANAKQQAEEAKIVVASMHNKDATSKTEPEQWMHSTIAAQQAEKSTQRLNEMLDAFTEQREEIAAALAQVNEATRAASAVTREVSADVMEMRDYLATKDATDAKVKSAVFKFFETDQSEKALNKTLAEIKKV